MFRINNLVKMMKGRYELIKGYENAPVTVGFGSYGQVKLGKDKQTGELVAIKIINKLAKSEVVFHNRLSHPKIIELLSYQVDRDKEITYMVLEYADGGTLFEKIRMNTLNKSMIKRHFRDVCEAISYLHGKEIMHRDIKPENVLLTKKKEAKLCDFGFAAILGERATLCGTYEYMSPEMIQGKPYDYKIDIWALGILLFQMIAGRAPFRGESPQEVINQMKTKIFFCQRFDKEEVAIIKLILRVTPYKRPDINQILAQPYFQQENTSTKGSEEESRIKLISVQSMSSGMMKKMTEVHHIQPNFYKPQTNSYPFYSPKMNQSHHEATNFDPKRIFPGSNQSLQIKRLPYSTTSINFHQPNQKRFS